MRFSRRQKKFRFRIKNTEHRFLFWLGIGILFVSGVLQIRNPFVPGISAFAQVPQKFLQVTPCPASGPCVLGTGTSVSDPWQDIAGDVHISGDLYPDYPAANNGTSISPGIRFGAGSGEGITSPRTSGSTNQYGLNFYTNFTPRMYVSVGGNVGIGTPNPGIANLNINNGGSNVGLYIGDTTTAPYGQAQLEINSPSGLTHIWAQEAGTRVFSVTSGGRIDANGVIYTPQQVWGSQFVDSNNGGYYLDPDYISNINAGYFASWWSGPNIQLNGNPRGWPDVGCTNCADSVNGNPNLWLTAQGTVETRAPGGLNVGGSGALQADLSVGGRIVTGDGNGDGGIWLDNTGGGYTNYGDIFIGQNRNTDPGQNDAGIWTNGAGWSLSVAQNGDVKIGSSGQSRKLCLNGNCVTSVGAANAPYSLHYWAFDSGTNTFTCSSGTKYYDLPAGIKFPTRVDSVIAPANYYDPNTGGMVSQFANECVAVTNNNSSQQTLSVWYCGGCGGGNSQATNYWLAFQLWGE